MSVHFLGKSTRGLEIEFEGVDLHNEGIRWERYEARQSGGISEWLVALAPNRAIKDAQGMLCAASGQSETTECFPRPDRPTR